MHFLGKGFVPKNFRSHPLGMVDSERDNRWGHQPQSRWCHAARRDSTCNVGHTTKTRAARADVKRPSATDHGPRIHRFTKETCRFREVKLATQRIHTLQIKLFIQHVPSFAPRLVCHHQH